MTTHTYAIFDPNGKFYCAIGMSDTKDKCIQSYCLIYDTNWYEMKCAGYSVRPISITERTDP